MTHRSTVLIVTPEQTRSVQVNTRLLLSMRPLLMGLGAVIVALLGALAAIGWGYWGQRQAQSERHQQAQVEHQQLLEERAREIEALHQQLEQARDTQSAEMAAKAAEVDAKLAELKKSEHMLAELREYLKARGVNVKPVSVEPPRGKPNKAAGGPVSSREVRQAPGRQAAVEDAGDLLQVLQSVPLGMPHNGPISSRFGNRSNPFTGKGSEFHGGLDLKGSTGQPIRVTAKGKVHFAGVQSGYGNVVMVDHAHGYSTVYAHLSKISVKAGQHVEAGSVIGQLGSTGRSTGPHLHYEVQSKGQRIDPEQFLSLNAPVRKQLEKPASEAVP